MSVLGVRELDLLYERLKRSTANKIARPALSKAATVAVRKIKASIPGRYKDVRKAIGKKSLKTKATGGIASVKVGAAVGKKQESQKSRTGRKGVGIGARNVHWWFLGTEDRWTGVKRRRRKGASPTFDATGNKVKYTGSMPAQSPGVDSILSASSGELAQVMRNTIQQRLMKEVAKKGL